MARIMKQTQRLLIAASALQLAKKEACREKQQLSDK
jgi:hypothetical protein